MNKLAFTGITGAGKDFLVQHLVQNYGFKRYSFSDQLKKLQNMTFPWLELDYQPIIKEQPLNIQLKYEKIESSPRDVWLFMNKLRDIENYIFIRMLEDEINSKNEQNIVISDIRPEIEYNWCKENGYKIIFIEPKEFIYGNDEFGPEVQKHRENADYIFTNNFNGIDEFDIFIKELIHVS